MGRFDIATDEKKEMTGAELPHVWNSIRWISKTNVSNPMNNVYAVDEVNADMSNLVSMGYKLKSTHYLGENPEAYGVLYIFDK